MQPLEENAPIRVRPLGGLTSTPSWAVVDSLSMQFGLNQSIIHRSMCWLPWSQAFSYSSTFEYFCKTSAWCTVFLLYRACCVTAGVPNSQLLVQTGVIFALSCCQGCIFLGTDGYQTALLFRIHILILNKFYINTKFLKVWAHLHSKFKNSLNSQSFQ